MTDNELRWLAYADWLEERKEDRAAFIARDAARAQPLLLVEIPAPVYDAGLNEWVWMNCPPEERGR